MIVITAFMLGMSNGMNAEDRTVSGNQIHTEQQDKKDWIFCHLTKVVKVTLTNLPSWKSL